jgi:hypothetical protein
MIMESEFIHVDNEMNLSNRKQLQALEADDYRKALFIKCMD